MIDRKLPGGRCLRAGEEEKVVPAASLKEKVRLDSVPRTSHTKNVTRMTSLAVLAIVVVARVSGDGLHQAGGT